jgi:hypothetical protein
MLINCHEQISLTPAHFTAICGVITIILLLWNNFKPSKVYGKTISKAISLKGRYDYTNKNNEPEVILGQVYLLKLSLSCSQKTLHYADVNIFVTYGKEEIKCHIYYTEYFPLNENFGDLNGKKMKTPANEFLTYNSVLQEGKTTFYYVNFIVPCEKDIQYDKLTLEFIKPNKHKVKIEIKEIDSKQFFVDYNLIENQ